MSTPVVAACPICSAKAHLIYASYPGYRKPETYDLFECCYCHLQFAWPFSVPAGIYENIYRLADIIPGYSRYAEYAKAVGVGSAPLEYLAAVEPMYWFISRAMKQFSADAHVVELGSGYGYLTYALSKAGYNIKGVDVAASAVDAAKRRFGDLFLCEDISEYARRLPAKCDVVVMTEVLEHLDQPLDVLSSIRAALRPGGSLLVTTPDRGYYSDAAVWHTDLPPVHLAWYSKTALREMARRVDMSIRFQDFSDYHGVSVPEIKPEQPRSVEGPILDCDATVIRRAPARPPLGMASPGWWQSLIAALSRKREERRLTRRIRRRFCRAAMTHFARESEVIGAILTKPGQL